MPKVLCITGIVISILVLILFILDLLVYFISPALAPFGGASLVLDVVFALAAGALGYLSWTTYKEQ